MRRGGMSFFPKPHESYEVSFLHWLGDKIPLCFMAAKCLEQFKGIRILDTFRDDFHFKIRCQIYDGLYNSLIVDMCRQITNKDLL